MMHGQAPELRLTRVALKGNPSKKTIVEELTKKFRHFGKYLEKEKENQDRDNHVISKAMRFHSRPKRVSMNKKMMTEVEKTQRDMPNYRLDAFCESNIKQSKGSKDSIKERHHQRRILTEMNQESSVMRKAKGRSKNFLLHNFNKTRQSHVQEEKPETMPMKNVHPKLKKHSFKEPIKDPFMLSPWNHSLLNQNKENIFF